MMLISLCCELLNCSTSLPMKSIDVFQHRHLSLKFGREMRLVHARFHSDW